MTLTFFRGNNRLLDPSTQHIGIVGARACTAYGSNVACDLARGLTNKGYTVVSGGAYGIDAAAIRGSLEVGGKPVVVLPCGVDVASPEAHASLFDRVVKAGGCLASAYPDRMQPTRDTFLARNDEIVDLVNMLIVVEGTYRSGTSNVADTALRRGRLLGAVPGPITSKQSELPNHLLARLKVQAIRDEQDVIDLIHGAEFEPDIS